MRLYRIRAPEKACASQKTLRQRKELAMKHEYSPEELSLQDMILRAFGAPIAHLEDPTYRIVAVHGDGSPLFAHDAIWKRDSREVGAHLMHHTVAPSFCAPTAVYILACGKIVARMSPEYCGMRAYDRDPSMYSKPWISSATNEPVSIATLANLLASTARARDIDVRQARAIRATA